MALWTQWLELIRTLLHFVSTDIGLGGGLAILVVTLLLRVTLLPLSWSIGYRGIVRQKQMVRLQPELQRLKTRFANEPRRYAEQMQALYQENGLSMMDGRSLLSSLAQMPVLVGMYQVLRDGFSSARQAATRSITVSRAIICVPSSAAPSSRDSSSRSPGSNRPWKSNVPPPVRNARISAVRCCWESIQAASAHGSSASTHPRPSGEAALPAMCSRSRGHSSATALDSARGDGISGSKLTSLWYLASVCQTTVEERGLIAISGCS